jgi:hypothetical protein
MSDPLDQASAKLLERLIKEENGPDAGPTRELGGVAQVSVQLETLLRLLLDDMARAQRTTADVLINEGAARPVPLERATAGHLVKTLSRHSRKEAARRPQVRLLMEELALPRNRIRGIVDARNDIVHGTRAPDSARREIAQLRALIEDYRVAAGWAKAELASTPPRRRVIVEPRGRRPG